MPLSPVFKIPYGPVRHASPPRHVRIQRATLYGIIQLRIQVSRPGRKHQNIHSSQAGRQTLQCHRKRLCVRHITHLCFKHIRTRRTQVFQTARPTPHHSDFHLSAFRIQTSQSLTDTGRGSHNQNSLHCRLRFISTFDFRAKLKGSHRIFLEVFQEIPDFNNFFRMALTVSGVTPINEAISFSGRCSFSSG